jgi:putative ABC transport system substrate-binding protein
MNTRRRLFIATAAAGLVLLVSKGNAQSRIYRMAFLSGQSPAPVAHLHQALMTSLRQLGYREGENLVVERRYAEGRLERLPALAAELVALKPDVFFASASQPALAAIKATGSIPIVFVAVSDPVGIGLVKSLARPGTNATGLSAQNIEVHSKRLQLLKEIFVSASEVTVLHNPLNVVEHHMIEVLKKTAGPLNIELRIVEIRSEQEIEPVFRTFDSRRVGVLYVLESPFSVMHRVRIVELINSRRLPAVYGLHEFVDAGGLMAYSFPLIEHFRVGAQYVDKVLKGAKPAELAVQQPTRFELILNLKTAKAQGVTFPPTLMARADRVVE